jgi:hypothetical protein
MPWQSFKQELSKENCAQLFSVPDSKIKAMKKRGHNLIKQTAWQNYLPLIVNS